MAKRSRRHSSDADQRQQLESSGACPRLTHGEVKAAKKLKKIQEKEGWNRIGILQTKPSAVPTKQQKRKLMRFNLEDAESIQEVAKKLAHVEQNVRVKAMKQVEGWIRRQSSLGLEQFRILWKAFFYSFWLADGPRIQREIAIQLCSIGCVPPEKRLQWIEAFYETIIRDWHVLDKYRVDKFLLLLRIFLAETLAQLHRGGWRTEEVKEVIRVWTESGPLSTTPGANHEVMLHFIDVFADELKATIYSVTQDDDVAKNTSKNAGDTGNKLPDEARHLLLDALLDLACSSNEQVWLQEKLHKSCLLRLPHEAFPPRELALQLFRRAGMSVHGQQQKLLFEAVAEMDRTLASLGMPPADYAAVVPEIEKYQTGHPAPAPRNPKKTLQTRRRRNKKKERMGVNREVVPSRAYGKEPPRHNYSMRIRI